MIRLHLIQGLKIPSRGIYSVREIISSFRKGLFSSHDVTLFNPSRALKLNLPLFLHAYYSSLFIFPFSFLFIPQFFLLFLFVESGWVKNMQKRWKTKTKRVRDLYFFFAYHGRRKKLRGEGVGEIMFSDLNMYRPLNKAG
jgi:hypothetical protein